MTDDEKLIADAYQDFAKITKDPVAAAILTLVSRLSRPVEVKLSADPNGSLSHELCMGIRHGLFGAGADAGADVRHVELQGGRTTNP